ncbi:hypothetical protein T552_03142 [Pneumocystis carinii B80]|uniref:cyclin-dependent kinase n=1 Tax=Pneumocystis carinii (strain B80) TaxID=1408658 RepID=A0A0W4ZBY1_PNEC8|nr:hypothetical protein T552_03142 [Pneumocystis carinii B80]KTW25868.1 hypothetical protein T552_03142 [Pneumocystis carinii B80]
MSPSYLKIHSVTGEKIEVDISYKNLYLGTCISICDFEKLNRIGEGTYGVVYRAKDKRNNTIVALKAVRIFDNDRYSGIPITALREISLLRSLKHKNIISVLEVAVGEALDDIYMVDEYREQDMASMMDTIVYNLFNIFIYLFIYYLVKCLMKQLLEGVEYLHRQNIIHRDLKMSNLLLNAKGILKIADFGMAREYRDNGMTPRVVTIWYRSPELLFGKKNYTSSVDLWSVGCILGELMTSAPLFPGKDEAEQKFSNQTTTTKDLINCLLTYNPEKRILAKAALNHEYFQESPQAQDPSLLPTFPEIRNKQKNDYKS